MIPDDDPRRETRAYKVGYAIGSAVPGLFIGGALGCVAILVLKVFGL